MLVYSWVAIGVVVGPGLRLLTRMFRLRNSFVQLRANERTDALVAL